jgi:hypothetical protein
LKPSYDFVVRYHGVLRFKGLPAAIQFGDIVDVYLYGADCNRRQLRDQFRHSHAALGSALLKHQRSAVVNFDGLGFHA